MIGGRDPEDGQLKTSEFSKLLLDMSESARFGGRSGEQGLGEMYILCDRPPSGSDLYATGWRHVCLQSDLTHRAQLHITF